MKLVTALFVLLVGVSWQCHTADSQYSLMQQKLRIGERYLDEKRKKCELQAQLHAREQQVAQLFGQKICIIRRFLAEKTKKCELEKKVVLLQAENADLKRQLAEARGVKK